MTGPLGTLRVPPLYGQVVIECEGATDLPMPETGTERVVSTTQSILVATRGDLEGDVLIEVHAQAPGVDLGRLVFEGELNCPTPRLVFGSSIANLLETIELDRAGWIPIKVFVDPPDAPSRVTAVLA